MQGKVVVVGGTPRAGKTTLAVGLARNGFSMISFDHLSSAIQKGFPQVMIEDWTSQEICASKMYSFFESIVESAISDAKIYGINTVIDMYSFTPDYISKLPFRNEIQVYFLAYPNITAEEIRHNIRFYAEPTDWIAEVEDDYLNIVAQRCYRVNEKLVRQCAEFGCELINTFAGADRQIVLGELLDKILKK